MAGSAPLLYVLGPHHECLPIGSGHFGLLYSPFHNKFPGPKSFIINPPPTWKRNCFGPKSVLDFFKQFLVFSFFKSDQLEKEIVLGPKIVSGIKTIFHLKTISQIFIFQSRPTWKRNCFAGASFKTILQVSNNSSVFSDSRTWKKKKNIMKWTV